MRVENGSVWSVLLEFLIALWWFFVAIGIAKFLVVPLAKWMLVTVFESLKGASGAGRTVRRLLAFPITGLLSTQRKARGGHRDSRLDLFTVDLVFGVVVSGFLQGILLTAVSTIVVVVLCFLIF
ncbi:hypothetical protein [Amycolatopsis sp. DSM 110486]|uniref:hypothetical protein n=1 Tax=Amycolatopsis sp. DSM 110486 TaxID=2865832 RepID=UPI001C6A55FA|nr:hypothetical protein [Amycolatopsis sp. DSM 110486]QYN23945.1 hypothetical protein K1T34_16755 [Amycolatopsis sp. DSM 110486]